MGYLKNFYDLPTTWSSLDVFHDLQARRYYVQNLDNEEPQTVDFALYTRCRFPTHERPVTE